MGVLFVARDADASSFCTNPVFSYFVVSGSLLAVAEQSLGEPAEVGDCEQFHGVDRSPQWFDAQDKARQTVPPAVLVLARHHVDRGGSTTPLFEANIQTARDLDDTHGRSTAEPYLPGGNPLREAVPGAPDDTEADHRGVQHGVSLDTHNDQVHGGTACSAGILQQGRENSRSMSLRVETVMSDLEYEKARRHHLTDVVPLRPGHGLDDFIFPSSSPSDGEREGPIGSTVVDTYDENSSPLYGYHCTDKTASSGGARIIHAMNPRFRWRLNATKPACIGRISRRLLKQLEMEEPQREMAAKVSLLQKSEVGVPNRMFFIHVFLEIRFLALSEVHHWTLHKTCTTSHTVASTILQVFLDYVAFKHSENVAAGISSASLLHWGRSAARVCFTSLHCFVCLPRPFSLLRTKCQESHGRRHHQV